MLNDSESAFLSRNLSEFTTSFENVAPESDSPAVIYIKVFKDLSLIWLKVIPGLVYGTGLIANLLLAIYLIKYKRYRSPIFALILSMCFADTMMCASAIVWATVRSPFLIGPTWLCSFLVGFLYPSLLSSEYHLVVIAIVRFYQLVFPLSARVHVTPTLMAKVCLGVWVFSITTSTPFAILDGPIYAEYEGHVYSVCTYIGDHGTFIMLYLAIVNLIAPFVLTAAFHIAKHCMVLRTGSTSADSMTPMEQKRGTTDTRAVMLVITVYLITATPDAVLNLLIDMPPIHPLINFMANAILWLNSTLNPFIYAFAAQSMRRDVVRMLRCSAKAAG